MLLLLLTLLLLLPLAMLLWRPRSQDARQSWLVRLQHRVAWGALRWAAAWQQEETSARARCARARASSRP